MVRVLFVTSRAEDARWLEGASAGLWAICVPDHPCKSLQSLLSRSIDVVLLDLFMRGENSMRLIAKLSKHRPELPLIALHDGSHGSLQVRALQVGARAVMSFPCDFFRLRASVERLVACTRRMVHPNREEFAERMQSCLQPVSTQQMPIRPFPPMSDPPILQGPSLELLVGSTPAMRELLCTVARVADSSDPVLVMGESGTGKEVISRIIHENSPYSQGTIYSLNVSCIPETLAESELFGTVRGAYTDAEMAPGIFESATGGSVFLDEIGELSQALQPKLLRVLEEKTVRPVGGRQAKPVSFRLICATNRDLYQAADRGSFRYDLLFRIDVLRIEIPPLRDRLEDIPLLARHWLTRYRKDISTTAIERLCGYPWPGNVRELHACLSRAANDSRGDVIHEDSIRF